MVVTVVVIVAALLVGLLANRFIRARSRGDDENEGYSLNDLMSPFETLAVLLLAFVLVVAAESFDAAEQSVKAEADAIENLYEVASYAPHDRQRTLQSSVICYTRAIKALEWPIMMEGGISTVVDHWTNDFTKIFDSLSGTPYFELLVEADQERSGARNTRIAHAQPAIPTPMFWFMAAVLGISVAGFAFAIPRRNNVFQVGTVTVLTALFALSLALIRDIDRPFSGLVSVGSGPLAVIREHISGLYDDKFGLDSLPCDDQGRPAMTLPKGGFDKTAPEAQPGDGPNAEPDQ